MSWLAWLGLLLVLLAVAAAGISAYGAKRWTDFMRALTRSLEAARLDDKARSASPARFDSRDLEGLPAPVQRYFRAVLKDGQPIVSALTIDMAGTFNMSAAAEQWKPFTSQQRVVTHRPGFLWEAKVSMLPGLVVRVLDSYIAGAGLLNAAILGLVPVAKVSGGGEIARGGFMRFLAEAVWYPTALLPSQGVRWEAVDDRSANATIVDGPLTLTLLFRFNDGRLDRLGARPRARRHGGQQNRHDALGMQPVRIRRTRGDDRAEHRRSSVGTAQGLQAILSRQHHVHDLRVCAVMMRRELRTPACWN
jgi:hypothetical protein